MPRSIKKNRPAMRKLDGFFIRFIQMMECKIERRILVKRGIEWKLSIQQNVSIYVFLIAAA